MKLHTLRLAIVLAVLVFALGATALQAQDPDYRIVPLTVQNNGGATTVDTFGIHINATYCNDGTLNPGGLVEEELPPKPPSDVFDIRFTDHRSPACMGTGQRVHLQECCTLDTFKVEIQAGEGGYPVTFTWPSGLDADWDNLVIQDPFGGLAGVNVNMLTATTAQVTNSIINTLFIIGTGKTVDVKREGELVPQKFGLDQNYPNPFNPSTTFRFAIEKTAFTTVAIYNVIGQKVKTLTASTLTPGFYTTTWNGTDENGRAVTTGVYFARMSAIGEDAEFNSLRKLLLMK